MSYLEGFHLERCAQCGKCTASCPAGRDSSLRIRRLVLQARSGADVSADGSLWACTTCYSCQERCPKGVGTADAIIAIRNRASREGNRPSIHMAAIRSLLDTSDGFPLSPEVARLRSMLGLPKEPRDVAHDQFERERFRRLVASLPIASMLEGEE